MGSKKKKIEILELIVALLAVESTVVRDNVIFERNRGGS